MFGRGLSQVDKVGYGKPGGDRASTLPKQSNTTLDVTIDKLRIQRRLLITARHYASLQVTI